MTTPAHLLLLPLDKDQVVNFFSLRDAGLSSLKEATAFKKITTASKTLTSDLATIGASYTARYKNLHRLFLSDGSFTKAANFSLIRPHNTLVGKASLRHNHVVLDKTACDKFLAHNYHQSPTGSDVFGLNRAWVEVATPLRADPSSTVQSVDTLRPRTAQTVTDSLNPTPSEHSAVNVSSDDPVLNAPLEKAFNKKATLQGLQNLQARTGAYLDTLQSTPTLATYAQALNRAPQTTQRHFLAAPNQQVLAPEQSPRQFATQVAKSTLFQHNAATATPTTLPDLFNLSRTGWVEPTH